ncbi:MAG: tetratricopeptide repeat protein [Candidatus Binatia bacterium]
MLGRHGEAIVAYKRLLTRNPDHSRAYFFLALLYHEIGRKEDARAALAASQRISPTYSFQQMRSIVPYKDQTLVDRWMAVIQELGRH